MLNNDTIIFVMNTLFIDVETTGLPENRGFNNYHHPSKLFYYKNSRLIELAYIIYNNNNEIVKKVENLIKPVDFTIENSEFHGITTKMALTEGKDLSKVLDELCNDLDNVDTIVAHNINFDINIILAECYKEKKQNLIKHLESINRICTMDLGKTYMNTKKYPKLIELYQHLFDKTITQEHRALSDTHICADCYYEMIRH